MKRAAGGADAGREYRTVFELGGVPAYEQFYENGIFVWKAVYRGLYRPWHIVAAPTVENASARRELYRMNAAKALCQELSSLVWGDGCVISVTMAGRERGAGEADPLGEWVDKVLRDNAFHDKMPALTEQALALGGAAVKVWYGAARAADGRAVPGSGSVWLDYCAADQFVPTAWDNAGVTEGVFISRTARDGFYYTRLEWHRRSGTAYTVRNELYRSMTRRDGDGSAQDILGVRRPLDEAYPYLAEETIVPGGERLFSYFRTPAANNLCDETPLGVSMYANAMPTLHALDICYDSFVREFRLGKKRIIVPARAVRTVVDPVTNRMRRYFDPADEAYEALAGDDPGDLKITDNSVELRVEDHVRALNAFLSVLCLQTGFSASTFSFDERSGVRTATEVVSENSKTYKTVRAVQNRLRPCVEQIVRSVIDVACLYDLEYRGRKIARLAKDGYHVSVSFDDGVTQDRQTNIAEGVTLVNAGLLSRFRFLTDRKYGQGLTEEEASAELGLIRTEKTMKDST